MVRMMKMFCVCRKEYAEGYTIVKNLSISVLLLSLLVVHVCLKHKGGYKDTQEEIAFPSIANN